MTNSSRELALRAHIRNLLLDYSLTYLTTDYVTFTENAVSELLHDRLTPVSLIDPTSPALGDGVYECLNNSLKLDSCPLFSEHWSTQPNVTAYIKQSVSSLVGRTQSSRCWHDTSKDVSRDALRPMSPILTAVSIRETPLVGDLSRLKKRNTTQEMTITSYGVNTIACEDKPDIPDIRIGELPQMRFVMDSEMHTSVMNLISTNPGVARVSHSHSIENLAAGFLRGTTPPLEILQLRSPPIFPRDRRPGAATTDSHLPCNLPRLSELPTIIAPVKVENDDDGDSFKQHMMVVDGWECYVNPSSPTPSLGSSSSQEIDELFLPSPPRKTDNYLGLLDARLDDYEIPRSEKFGGSTAKPKRIGDNETLSSFLLPFLQTTLPKAPALLLPEDNPPPPSVTNMSTRGEPSEIQGDTIKGDAGHDFQDVLRIFGRGKLEIDEDPLDIIVKEKLDEKGSMLLEVPHLPSPHEHAPNGIFLPITPCGLVAPDGKVQDENTLTVGFLQKVTGIQSLNIELSWRPFSWKIDVPTDDALARVIGKPKEDLIDECRKTDVNVETQFENFLAETLHDPAVFDSAAFYTSKWLEEHDEPRNSDYVGHDYVLTREERRRLHNQPYPVLEDSYDEAKPDAEGIHLPSGRKAPSESLEIAPRLNKRPRITPNVPDYDPHEWGMDVTLDLADLILPSEDSGVYMAEPGFPQLPDSDSMFAALAQDAEGLDGPHVPTEMFPDLDDRYLLSPRPDIDHIETYLQPVSEDDMLNYLVFSPHSSQLPQDIGIHDPPHDSCDRPVIETKLLSDPQIQEPDPVQEKPNPRLQSNVQDPPILELEKALLASGRQSLAAFLELRARKMSMDSLPREPTPSPDVQPERIIELSEPLPIKIPQEVVDRFTISLSVSVASTPTRHKYMASMDVMSKRDLLRCFSLPQYSIDLVERETLLGAHLILDPGTAVYLVPLMSLPSQLDEHLDTIGKLSWQFLNLLVIFESFLLSRYSSTIQAQSSHTTRPNPFSPPVIKSVRKLRRDLGISEAFQTTRSECMIQYAFALEVEEVATFVRFYGDSAEGKDMSGGLIWGDRAWLDVQEPDGEFDLACAQGMNLFASSMILSHVALEEFLDWPSERREQIFGPLIGVDRIVQFNKLLATRAEVVQLPSSSPISTSFDTLENEMNGQYYS